MIRAWNAGAPGILPRMASRNRKQDQGVVSRLADRGEDATTRLLDLLSSNLRVTDALTKAAGAKGRLDSVSKGALSQIGLAPADDVKDLRKQVERLEKRLAKLESGGKPTAKRSETKKTPSAKRRTTKKTTSSAAEEAASPAPGRAIGGASSRGSGSAGGSAGS